MIKRIWEMEPTFDFAKLIAEGMNFYQNEKPNSELIMQFIFGARYAEWIQNIGVGFSGIHGFYAREWQRSDNTITPITKVHYERAFEVYQKIAFHYYSARIQSFEPTPEEFIII